MDRSDTFAMSGIIRTQRTGGREQRVQSAGKTEAKCRGQIITKLCHRLGGNASQHAPMRMVRVDRRDELADVPATNGRQSMRVIRETVKCIKDQRLDLMKIKSLFPTRWL
jgi:hypothetical protein